MVKFERGDLILNFDRIRSASTDFIRSNPITTAAVAIGVPLSFAGIAAVGRRVATRKKRKKAVKRKVKRRKTTNGRKRKRKTTRRGKRKRVTHRSPRHKGHKRVSFTTADGKKVNFLVRRKGGKSHK